MYFAVPSVAPRITHARNTSSTSVYISWERLTPSQLHGSTLLSYLVFYKKSDGSQVQKLSVKLVNLVYIIINIYSLQKFSPYTFRVVASTNNGNGIASEPVTVLTGEDGKFE